MPSLDQDYLRVCPAYVMQPLILSVQRDIIKGKRWSWRLRCMQCMDIAILLYLGQEYVYYNSNDCGYIIEVAIHV